MIASVLSASAKTNCKPDVDKLLFDLKGLSDSKCFLPSYGAAVPTISRDVEKCLAEINPKQMKKFGIEEENILFYIAGYVARKVSRKVCGDCQALLMGELDPEDPCHSFLQAKKVKETDGLVVPSQGLFQLVSQFESLYNALVIKFLYKEKVRVRLVTALMDGIEFPSCSVNCETLLFCASLYTTLRLHHSLKEENLTFPSSKASKNRKVLQFRHA
jgi:hypothetical protein